MKCGNCGNKDSLDFRDRQNSSLIMAFGNLDPKDGAQRYYVFCKRCRKISVYKPKGWGRTRKFVGFENNIPFLIVELESMTGFEAAPVPPEIVKGLAGEMSAYLRVLLDMLEEESQKNRWF